MRKLLYILLFTCHFAFGQGKPPVLPGAGSSFTPNWRYAIYDGAVMPWLFINNNWYPFYTASYVNAKFQPLLPFSPASIAQLSALNSRRQADSTALGNEVVRAKLIEDTKASKAYVGALHARVIADSIKLVNEAATRQLADAGKANNSQLSALDNRVGADSVRLVNETGRAKVAEMNLSNRIARDSNSVIAEANKARLAELNLSNRIQADSNRVQAEVSRAIVNESLKIDRSDAISMFQPKGIYLVSETDPNYSANGVPKTRQINTGYGLSGGSTLANDVTVKVDTTAMATKASLAAYIKGVKLAGGSATFTTSSLLAGATTNVTVPLNATFSDTNYQLTQPVVLTTSGVSLLSSLTVNSIIRNTTSVIVQLKNSSLLSVAVSGTVELVAIKVQ